MAIEESFHNLRIAQVDRLAPDAIAVTLDVPEVLQPAFRFKPGQHMAVRAMIEGKEERRTYSIASGSDGVLRVGIREVPGGIFSTWAQSALKPGVTLDVAGPVGRFVLPAGTGAARHILFVSAGAGITPVLGMIVDALEREPETSVTLLYGNRSTEAAMFLEEIEGLKDRFPARFDLLHILSRGGDGDTPILEGRLTGDKIKELAERRIDFASLSLVYLCGPGSMIKDVRNALEVLGVKREAIKFEFFAASAGAYHPVERVQARKAVATGDQITATAILDGVRTNFLLSRGQHVLEAVLKVGVKAPYSCTGGMCCTCRARVVEGTASMTVNYSLEPWEIDKGFVLTCQAVATGDKLVIDYDAM
ncbi:MAG: 2Fe-2S iron-sulfur cluster binding domain-containing protein [Hyphomicrobiaceae bacterium]|nr:2Fe-2S iron-sulfur cluster binding domain-containing protein [Hyphomicrobiaceae bacterium]